ncbi:MAG TPA: hypothetical protein VNW46_16240, partial [Gemmatimonadaceae bacterium]|nr:hypothetical protein [Gemmatimonadaceae bacterium]
TNFFWLNALPLYQEGRPFDDLLDNSEITAMTPARVRAAARQYLSVQRYLEFDLIPTLASPNSAPGSATGKPVDNGSAGAYHLRQNP